MSANNPKSRTFIIDDPTHTGINYTSTVVTLVAGKVVHCSNYIDLRDGQDNTVATLTWPTKYKVREI